MDPSFWTCIKSIIAFSKLKPDYRRIVIYSEGKSQWPFLCPFVRALLNSSCENISYISSQMDDPGLNFCSSRVRGFVVGSGFWRIWWFLTLNADVLLMTMPDLNVYHIKRSMVHPVHYVYANHGCDSFHMVLREQAVDFFDTIFCSGPHNVEEIRKREKIKGLHEKNVVEVGYPYQDELIAEAGLVRASLYEVDRPIKVLLAPSWSEKGLGTLETVGIELISCLLTAGLYVFVRPHPQTCQYQPECISAILQKFSDNLNFTLELDTTNRQSLLEADILISDWSAIALEFAFSRFRPVLYIDVPRKIMNKNYEKLAIEPFEVRMRNEVGTILSPKEIQRAPEIIQTLCEQADEWAEHIRSIRDKNVYNVGKSAGIGAKALLEFVNR